VKSLDSNLVDSEKAPIVHTPETKPLNRYSRVAFSNIGVPQADE